MGTARRRRSPRKTEKHFQGITESWQQTQKSIGGPAAYKFRVGYHYKKELRQNTSISTPVTSTADEHSKVVPPPRTTLRSRLSLI